MKRALMVVAVLVAALAGACGKAEPRPGEVFLALDQASRALVAAADTPSLFEKVDGSPTLHTGDRVKMVIGSARLTAANGVEYRIRAKDTELIVGRRPVLLTGQALVVAGNDAAALEAGDTQIEIVRGAARVVRDLAVNIGTYEGIARVSSAGRVLQVPALRQASIALAGELPGAPKPLQYQDSDAWDRRFLAVAMSLTTELDARSRGLTAQLNPESDRTAVIRRALPPLAVADLAILSARPVGEAIVGGAIAIETRSDDVAKRLGSVFGFRDQGATWGLVALDQRLQDAENLVESLDVALRRAPLSLQLASAPAPNAAGRSTIRAVGGANPGTIVPTGPATPPGPTTTQPGPTTTTSPLPISVPTTPPGPESTGPGITPDGGSSTQAEPSDGMFETLLTLLG